MLNAQGLAKFPANKAKITIDVNGAPHSALSIRGEEWISNGFEFVLTIIVDKYATLNSYIGATTRLKFHGQDGIARTVIGVVTKINEQGWIDDARLRVELTFESNLARLKHQKDTRIILGHSVPDMIKLTCERNGLIKDQLHFDLSRAYPVKPYTLQANESDWDFISRLAANSGIYFYSIEKDDQEVIIFTDHNAHCPYIAREVLHFIEPSGANKDVAGNALVGVHNLAANARQVIPQARIHDFNEETPSTQLLANTAIEPVTQLKSTPAPGETLFGLGSRTLDESDEQSKRIAEHASVLAFDLSAKGNVVDMAAGHICSMEATHFDAQYNGDYMITHVIHEASQFAGHAEGDVDIAYRAASTCIKRETPFRTATVKHPELPMTMTARIESDGPYARLDEQGKYQLRALFDLSSSQHTQASIPLRRVSPYGGLPNESNVGFHTPLHDGDEVLISCLNGDPDRPMVVGTLPNPERLSPVTSANPSQNRLRTMSDNELTFDDTKEKEAITLRTYSGYNILHLNHEAVGNKVRLATEHGAMVTFAKKTIHRQSDDTMTERVGNDRLVKVKNYHRTETQTKEIHHQAKTDHKHSAYKNIQTESGQNTELQTGRHMIMDVADNTRITVKGSGGLFATVQSNDVFIQSANKIDVKGQGGGDITFEQSGGGFKVSSSGVVSFYGKKVFFGGSGGVKLNGKVNYSVPGPNPPGAVNTTAPIAFAGIEELLDDRAPEIIHLSWSQKRAAVGQMVELRYTVVNVTPGDTANIEIYEIDSDGSEEKIDTLIQAIDDGHGHYTEHWYRDADDADKDIKNDIDKSEKAPLEYRFKVSTSNAKSELSPSLEIADTLEWKPVIDGFKRYAMTMTEENYIKWMQYIFENEKNEIPLDAFRQLLDILQTDASLLVPTSYVISQKLFQGGKNPQAGYMKDKRIVLVGRELVDKAIEDNENAFLLYSVLLEELGHHIDNLLRNEFSSVGGQSNWDEGAMFAFSMLKCKLDGVHDLRFAKYIKGDARDNLASRLLIKGWNFSKQRIMSDQKGWIVMPSGEIQFLSFFDAGEPQMCTANGIEQPCGGTHKSIEQVLKKVGPMFDSPHVINRIYFGNWLRDYSQLNDPAALEKVGSLVAIVPMQRQRDHKAELNKADEHIKKADQAISKAKTDKEKEYAIMLHKLAVQDKETLERNFEAAISEPAKKVAKDFIVDLVDLLAISEFRDPANYILDIADVKKGDMADDYKKLDKLANDIIDNKPILKVDSFRVTLDRLGGYFAPEHIDNPDLERDVTCAEHDINEQTWQKDHVAESIKYVKQQLKKAAEAGPTDDGMRHFGAALHTLEDYFAHSNYAEIKSLQTDTGNPALNTFIKKEVRVYTAKVKINNREIYPIVTGTFSKLDMIMSLTAKLMKFLPKDEAEMTNKNSFGSRLILLYLRRKDTTETDRLANFYEMILENKDFFKNYLPGLYKAVVDKLMALTQYLKRSALDMAQEYALELFIKALKNEMAKEQIAVPTYTPDTNKTKFENQWLELDNLVTVYKSETISSSKKKTLKYFDEPSNTDILRKRIYDIKTEDAIKQAYMLGKTYQDFNMSEDSTDPTHTQIGKDYYEQPLHSLVVQMAEHAVYEVGKRLYPIWFKQFKIAKADFQKALELAIQNPKQNWLKSFEIAIQAYKKAYTPLPADEYQKLVKELESTAENYMQHPAIEQSDWSTEMTIKWWNSNAKGFKYPPSDHIHTH